MKCTEARNWLQSKMDGELSDCENSELDAHLSHCASCNREFNLLNLPRRIAPAIPLLAPSPFFYQKLMMRIQGEAQRIAGWQVFGGLARKMVPALAGITLALLTIFAYFELRGTQTDLYGAYDRAFITEDQSNRMLVAGQGDITYEGILSAIAERQSYSRQNQDLK